MDQYLSVAEDHALLGYGRNNFPVIGGMTSIDNYYLLLSLLHGFIASSVLVILLFGTTIRLFRRGLLETDLGFPQPSLAFTLAAILVAVIFTLATVYMAGMVRRLFGCSNAHATRKIHRFSWHGCAFRIYAGGDVEKQPFRSDH